MRSFPYVRGLREISPTDRPRTIPDPAPIAKRRVSSNSESLRRKRNSLPSLFLVDEGLEQIQVVIVVVLRLADQASLVAARPETCGRVWLCATKTATIE